MEVDINETENHVLAEEMNDKMKNAVMPVTVFVGVEIVLGFFGNLIVFYVFLFRYHTCNFRYFVLCLALTDITSSLTTMPGEIVTQLYWFVYPVPLVCKIKSFFNVYTVSSEALCLLTIAVDRYRKVCQPLGWQIRPNVAKWLCLIIFGTSFAIAFPVAIYWGTHDERHLYKGINVTVTVCEKDHEYVDTLHPFQYSVAIEVILSTSLAVMFLLYVVIARTLFGSKLRYGVSEDNAKTHHSEQNKEETAVENVELESDTAPKRLTTPENRTSGTRLVVSVASDSEMSSTNKDSKTRTDSNPKRAATLSRQAMNKKVRRKTLIMFILTVTFIVTTSIYMALLSLIAHGILPGLSDGVRAVYFFFFRLYFINHVINPFVYGVLDPKFRKIMLTCKNIVKSTLTTSSNS